MTDRWMDCFIDWLIGMLVGLVDILTDWLIDRLVGWYVDRSIDWSVTCLTGRSSWRNMGLDSSSWMEAAVSNSKDLKLTWDTKPHLPWVDFDLHVNMETNVDQWDTQRDSQRAERGAEVVLWASPAALWRPAGWVRTGPPGSHCYWGSTRTEEEELSCLSEAMNLRPVLCETSYQLRQVRQVLSCHLISCSGLRKRAVSPGSL